MFFANSPIPMYILDAETLSFVDVNKSATEVYGYDKAHFLTMSLTDVVHPGGNRVAFPVSGLYGTIPLAKHFARRLA